MARGRRWSVPIAARWAVVVLLPLAMSIGCAPRTIQLSAADSTAPETAANVPDWTPWGLTLSRVVVREKVAYTELLRDHDALDCFLAQVSRVGPGTTPQDFPDRDSRLAYLINCHNAAVLRSIVELAGRGNPPARVPADIETMFRFVIDGRPQTAGSLRRAADELAGDDWRVALVLCDCTRSGPPLPAHPFLGDLLDAQLRQAAQAALQSPQVVRVEHGEEKLLLLWSGLFRIKDRLIRDYERRFDARNATFLNVLLERADPPQRQVLNSAVGYQIAEMPTDSTLNSVDPIPADEGLSGVLRSIRSINFLRP